MLIAVCSQSKLVSNADVNTMCQAVQNQLNQHVFPAWNMKGGTIEFHSDPLTVPANAWIVNVMDNPTQADALGYHSIDNDMVDAFIFAEPVLSNGGVALCDNSNPNNPSVASVLSHEVCEMVGDVYANSYCDHTDGKSYALELADPVESDQYIINVGSNAVSVSNFVYPSFFNPQAQACDAPFDYLKKLTAPFTMTKGGYMIYRTGGEGTEQQIFGEEMPEWKKEMKMNKYYRR